MNSKTIQIFDRLINDCDEVVCDGEAYSVDKIDGTYSFWASEDDYDPIFTFDENDILSIEKSGNGVLVNVKQYEGEEENCEYLMTFWQSVEMRVDL